MGSCGPHASAVPKWLACRLSQEVAIALEEASDCVRFLKPLKLHILRVTECPEFSSLPEVFGALMQTMLLVWRHSKYFNTSAKLLALLRRLGNSLLSQAKQYAPGLIHLILSTEFVGSSG